MESETGIQENVVNVSRKQTFTGAVRKHLKVSSKGCSELGSWAGLKVNWSEN